MLDDLQDKRIEDSAQLLYRATDHPPLDDMWGAIEERLDRTPRVQRHWLASRSFWSGVIAAAACLVIGFALGRSRQAPNVASVRVAAATPDSVAAYDRTTTALLGETVALLHSLPASNTTSRPTERFSAQASELLLTTRLLLDSPAAHDARLRDLLQDLELVLAQVARLPAAGKSQTDLELITEALTERDIVPRIRRVAAQMATSDN